MLFSDIGDLFLVMLLGDPMPAWWHRPFIPAPERMDSSLSPLGDYFWCLPIRQEAPVHLQSLHVSDIRITRYSGPYPGRGVSVICYTGYFPAHACSRNSLAWHATWVVVLLADLFGHVYFHLLSFFGIRYSV